MLSAQLEAIVFGGSPMACLHASESTQALTGALHVAMLYENVARLSAQDGASDVPRTLH